MDVLELVRRVAIRLIVVLREQLTEIRVILPDHHLRIVTLPDHLRECGTVAADVAHIHRQALLDASRQEVLIVRRLRPLVAVGRVVGGRGVAAAVRADVRDKE